ncbi:MAG: hypothetical protein [Microvirus sp.]|nr:MAG: hypothetical protein [Microvirus sp.]
MNSSKESSKQAKFEGSKSFKYQAQNQPGDIDPRQQNLFTWEDLLRAREQLKTQKANESPEGDKDGPPGQTVTTTINPKQTSLWTS